MNLGELISYLEKHNQDAVLTLGLGKPDSYRGYYDELAFDLVPDAKVSEMLAMAKGCVGATFHGYKGGAYKMDIDTYCNVAKYGDTGSELSRGLLDILFRFEKK